MVLEQTADFFNNQENPWIFQKMITYKAELQNTKSELLRYEHFLLFAVLHDFKVVKYSILCDCFEIT